MRADDLSIGSLVDFSRKLWDDSKVLIVGRILAKLTPNSAFKCGSIGSDLFLVEVDISGERSRMDMELLGSNDIVNDAIQNGYMELEQGSVPKRAGFMVLVSRHDLRNIVDDVLSKVLKEEGFCPSCGHSGEWKSMALICPHHGRFVG